MTRSQKDTYLRRARSFIYSSNYMCQSILVSQICQMSWLLVEECVQEQ